jgi:serine phosphatase RsbU (regulator of sigma subunit)
MNDNRNKVKFFHSLRTQLWIGALLLLGLTVSTISYVLIVAQGKTLTNELEKTVILQGRNVALSSQKALLHEDPEIELFPLVTRIIEQQQGILSVTVTDSDGLIQGDRDVVNVGKLFQPDFSGYRPVAEFDGESRSHETLYVGDQSYLINTPVLSQGQPIGQVFLVYSKKELYDIIARSVRITLTISLTALILALGMARFFFQRISRPMRAMMDGVESLASGDLNTAIKMPSRNEFKILASAFNEMAFRIAAAQKEHIVKERMDRELEIARDIQHTLLPVNVRIPDGYEIGHHYDSATEVGGDYFDVIPVGESKVGLVMADVSGKGVPGLVIMAMVKIMVQNLVARNVPPKEIVRKLNSALLGNIRRNMFVTFFVAVLDVETDSLVFSNAGHNPVVIYDHSTRRARLFKMNGPPMGTFPDHIFAEHLREYRLALCPGDVFLQYTDGLNESMNERGQQFTLNRIVDITNEHGDEGAESLVGRLVRAEAAFRGSAPQSDDLTLLAIGMKAAVTRETKEAMAASYVASDS